MPTPNPEALDALHDALPPLACKGLCWSSCGPITMSPLERERVEEAGVPIPPGFFVELTDGRSHGTVCPALDTEEKTCKVYEVRPTICRLWGVMKALRCPWGCRPEGGLMDDVEAKVILEKSRYYGGDPESAPPALVDLHFSRRDVQQALRRAVRDYLPVKEEASIEQVEGHGVISAVQRRQ